MKCPQYIEEALEKRANCAYRFIHYDCIIGEWLEKNGLLDKVEMYDIYGGCEAYCNPDDSANRITNLSGEVFLSNGNSGKVYVGIFLLSRFSASAKS